MIIKNDSTVHQLLVIIIDYLNEHWPDKTVDVHYNAYASMWYADYALRTNAAINITRDRDNGINSRFHIRIDEEDNNYVGITSAIVLDTDITDRRMINIDLRDPDSLPHIKELAFNNLFTTSPWLK